MSGRVGRDRFRRDYPPRSEEKNHHGRTNPPSRHIWVGNISHSISESTLANHFLQFGKLESIAFQPGRSYAFINFKNEEEAFVAVRELQGFVLAGNPLRIEFAKAEKSSTSSRDEDYLHRRDEQRPIIRGSPFSQRDSRTRHPSPEPSYTDKTKMSDKNAEPSEVLWIGFPALLKVDEMILRKAFSPFGEIVKISVFPGRSYAFVRFKNVMAACRAKETLQGKLFGNPRVHICFARNESGTSNSGRNSMNSPPSPHLRSYGRSESSDIFRPDRKFGNLTGDPSMRSPRFVSNLESGDPDGMNFGRKGNSWAGGNGAFEKRRYQESGSEQGLPGNTYEHRSSPPRDRGAHFSSPQQFPGQAPFYDDSWDLPEDALLFHGAKKLKTSYFPPEKELPEYPFSDLEQAKNVHPKMFPDFPPPEVLDKNFDSGPFGYKRIPDHTMNLTHPYGERSDHWNASYDGFQVTLPPNPVERKRPTPDPHQSSTSEEWKWEGTIAKGGTPVCRARCFPVGKVLDMILPEFIDCTARTGLDMLAKHYYQAASAWVIFFVPHSDPDIGFYNEFMNYLGEKQRAAVAKLDENTTLFLVPPSEFSEKVLKVPGKLSISGVILRLEHPGANFGSIHPSHENKDADFMPSHGDTSYKPTSPSGPYFPPPPFPNPGKSGISISVPGNFPTAGPPASFPGSAHAYGSMSDSMNENRHDYGFHQRNSILGSNWSPHPLQSSNHDTRNMASQASPKTFDHMFQGYNPGMPKTLKETSSSNYTDGILGNPLPGSGKPSFQQTKPPISSSMPVADLQPEQLARLASSLLGQKRQSGGISMGEDFRQSSAMNQSETSYRASQNYVLPNNQISSELLSSQFGQVQQQQQPSNVPPVPQRDIQTGASGNQQLQSTGTEEEVDADPQKRLQATLQLAAALLQQIQQGKGT